MFRQIVPSMSYPAWLDLVVTERIVSLTAYTEMTAPQYAAVVDPLKDQSAPVRSLQFEGPLVPGELPPKATGVYHNRLPCMRLTRPCIEGSVLGAEYAGRYFQAHAYSLIDLDDPSIGVAEKSDAAVWVCGIDYAGYLHPFYNAIAYETSTKMHPMRSVRNLGAPSCLFIYQPFADVPFTECSMTLKVNTSKGSRSNVTGWTEATDLDYLNALAVGLPDVQLTAGGGQIKAGDTATVAVQLIDGDRAPISHPATLYLEETGGYLPQRRVPAPAGSARFKVAATGLDPGDTFKVKVGFRNYSGLLDVPFEVV